MYEESSNYGKNPKLRYISKVDGANLIWRSDVNFPDKLSDLKGVVNPNNLLEFNSTYDHNKLI